MENLIEAFKNKALPSIQAKLINSFDGSIESILNFDKLNIVLNPTFSHHYFFVSGTSDEDTITTKTTDGSTAPWGTQTSEMESNSAILAHELKKEFMKLDICNSVGNSLTNYLNEKIHIKIGGKILKIKGLTTKSLF